MESKWIVGIAAAAALTLSVCVGLALREGEPPGAPAAPVTTEQLTVPSASPQAPATAPAPGELDVDGELGDDAAGAEEHAEHVGEIAIAESIGAEGVDATMEAAIAAAIALTTEPYGEGVDERAARLAPSFESGTDFTELVGPIRRMYPDGQVATIPGEVEILSVQDGSATDSVTYRVQLGYDGSFAAHGESVAKRYRESAVWHLKVTFANGVPLISSAEWAG